MPFLQVVLSGLIATSIMIVFMESIHRLHWARADMVEAIGTALTGNYQKSFRVGLFFDLFWGCVFSLVYYAFLQIVPISSVSTDLILMVALGVGQGLAVSMMLVVLVDASKTLSGFRTGTTGVILGYLSGHFVYALSLALLFLAFKVMPGTIA